MLNACNGGYLKCISTSYPLKVQLYSDFLFSAYGKILERFLVGMGRKRPEISVIDEERTLEKLLHDKACLSRFGDGEIAIIFGRSIYFQKYQAQLSIKLRRILKMGSTDDFLVGIPNFTTLKQKQPTSLEYWCQVERLFQHLSEPGKTYYSSFVTRPFGAKNAKNPAVYLENFKKIWRDRSLILINWDPAIVQHPLFRDCCSCRFIPCRRQHAFLDYQRLKTKILESADKHSVILLSAGPTATVLAYDLWEKGFQTLDIGHFSRVYKWLKNLRS